MSFELFNTNADICITMAAGAKSREVRDQWKELAANWRSKAHACKPNTPTPASEIISFQASPSKSPEPPVQRAQAKGANSPGSKATFVEVPLLPSVAPSLAPHDDKAALDAIWQAIHPKKSAWFVSPQ